MEALRRAKLEYEKHNEGGTNDNSATFVCLQPLQSMFESFLGTIDNFAEFESELVFLSER